MLVVMACSATATDVRRVVAVIEEMGHQARPMAGTSRTVVGVIGNDRPVDGSRLAALPGVSELIPITKPYKQASREWRGESTVIRLAGGLQVGGTGVVVMAGPCAVENERQILSAANGVRDAGATVLRGGSFKPRTSPYSFQGLGAAGLRLLARARAETGLCIVTEALDADGVGAVSEVADIIQIGARNMQNYSLLKAAGRAGKPVLLKRGAAATIEELLLAAEYILAEGNADVMLCERGIRSFDNSARNVLDLGAIPAIHRLSHLPVLVDPSHGTGRSDMVPSMARAAVAGGADGLLIEVHPSPAQALSDGAQSLDLPGFARLMVELRSIASVVERHVAEPAGASA